MRGAWASNPKSRLRPGPCSKLSVGGIVVRIKTGTIGNMLSDVAEEMGLMAEEHGVTLQVRDR